MPLQRLLDAGVREGVYSAAAAAMGLEGELRWQGALGRVCRESEAAAVTSETLFDLASFTKPLATALALMLLSDAGRLRLQATLGEIFDLQEGWLPADKRPLTVRSLLAHRGGLPAWRPFYEDILAAPPGERADMLSRLAAATPLEATPETVTIYSDLGFMLLQAVVERVSGQPLDRFCEERIYRPLGLTTLEFRPISGKGGHLGPPRQCAATEPGLIPGRPIFGEVHDENAWAAGGVAGHAGLFGSAGDVFRLLAGLWRAYAGEAVPPFTPAGVRRFFTPAAAGARALGFDVAGGAGSSAGRYFSPHSVGHLGFTGVSFWLDLESGQMVVLLTNRVHLGRDDKSRIQAFRPRFHEAASRALGFGAG